MTNIEYSFTVLIGWEVVRCADGDMHHLCNLPIRWGSRTLSDISRVPKTAIIRFGCVSHEDDTEFWKATCYLTDEWRSDFASLEEAKSWLINRVDDLRKEQKDAKEENS